MSGILKLFRVLKYGNYIKCINFTRFYSKSYNDESFLNGSSSQYVEDMYNAWLRDPNSVHPSWNSYFKNSATGSSPYQRPPNLGVTNEDVAHGSIPQTNPSRSEDPQNRYVNNETAFNQYGAHHTSQDYLHAQTASYNNNENNPVRYGTPTNQYSAQVVAPHNLNYPYPQTSSYNNTQHSPISHEVSTNQYNVQAVAHHGSQNYPVRNDVVASNEHACGNPPANHFQPQTGSRDNPSNIHGRYEIPRVQFHPQTGAYGSPQNIPPRNETPNVQFNPQVVSGGNTHIDPSKRELPKIQFQPSNQPHNHPGQNQAQNVPVGGIPPSDKIIHDHLLVQALIRRYQCYGHLAAQIDPLGIGVQDRTKIEEIGSPHESLRLTGSKIDMDTKFRLPPTTFIGKEGEEYLPLKEIVRRLESVYCRHIGAEYMYLETLEERDFIRSRLERPGALSLTPEQKRLILARLTRATEFEMFLNRKWSSVKRFGLEGCEMLIPGVKQIIDVSTEHGVEHVVMGIAHRGRLNLLANVCRKPLYQLFTQFANLEPEDEGSGDVKYHLGTHIQRMNRVTNKNVKLTLLANPSHLECVNPVALGRTKAEQFYRGDKDGKHCMAVLIHGDAAFCGQGVVYESFHLSYLPHYTTHGVIHIVINNQIGFTTDPRESRSSPYCSDVGRVVNAPIFHANADDPESVVAVCKIAADWRAKFHKDVVVDIVGYRRNGHNEVDEPMFTQPLMYTKIRQHKPILDQYTEKLIKEQVVSTEEVTNFKAKYIKICEDEFLKASKETKIHFKDWLDSPWTGFFEGKNPLKVGETGVLEETLAHIGKKFSSHPPASLNFVVHKGLERILRQRMDMVNKRTIDWSLGEAMAFGSLLKDGIHVRLSGEDVERGTFSHRHHVLHHQTIDTVTYRPLSDLYPDQANYTVCNSSLSEYGVLAFDLGYSMTNPNSLIMWEAQFGDFANTAQCIIDQFISSGQMKWVRQSGIVMLLPHGYEGMGPEHSCARPERYLQMCSDDPDVFPPEGPNFVVKQLNEINWIVANCTTPANLFHILRRQVTLPFRKPLILMTPKSLLRHPEVRSSFDDMLVGTEFKRIIPDDGSGNFSEVKKVLFCSGKVFYDVRKARNDKNLGKDIVIIRVEQLCPFPYDLIKAECAKYPNAKLFWVQEEPKNYGPYSYVLPRFKTTLSGTREVSYIGRPAAAAPATGNKVNHLRELENILNDATAL